MIIPGALRNYYRSVSPVALVLRTGRNKASQPLVAQMKLYGVARVARMMVRAALAEQAQMGTLERAVIVYMPIVEQALAAQHHSEVRMA